MWDVGAKGSWGRFSAPQGRDPIGVPGKIVLAAVGRVGEGGQGEAGRLSGCPTSSPGFWGFSCPLVAPGP